MAGRPVGGNAAAQEAPVVGELMHRVPYFPSASDAQGREGFARVINHSHEGGEVSIGAFDDDGTSYRSLTLAIGADASVHFNSRDLENGNAGKGLTGSTGPGSGAWRLELSSELDIEVLAYVRTADGFLTAMHDTVAEEEGRYRVAVFNPGSNASQMSLLRVSNPGDDTAEVSIAGVDDDGASPGPGAAVSVPAGASRTYTAAELESGNAADLEGSIGDGTGKWRLILESAQPVVAMSLLSSPTGHLTNLSTAPDIRVDGTHVVPLFPSASDARGHEGFVRVANRSDATGEVTVRAFDDTTRVYEPLTLSLGPNETRHFNSRDLEGGNSAKGLSGSTGAGEGAWRLELSSDLAIDVLAYLRTEDGFLTAMHDTAPRSAKRHRVAVFNPGSNVEQASLLRLVNRGGEAAAATIRGIDGNGASPGSEVVVAVPASAATTLTAQALETGDDGFEGALGDGAGKWRLSVTADRPIIAMSLLSSPTGHLTNLSTAPGRGAGPVETAGEAFEALVSPVVQSRCVNCHVQGGASGGTRLVFVKDDDADHLTKNLAAFENFLTVVREGSSQILDKIQGRLDHGGGTQVAAGTPEYARIERFLAFLLPVRMTVAGTVYSTGDQTAPLAGAECEFAALGEGRLGPVRRLAARAANGEGAFRMLVPSESVGYLVCWPQGMPATRLWSFLATGAAGTTTDGLAVSPRTTVAAMALTMDVARTPRVDMVERAAALADSLAGDAFFELLVEVAAGLFGVLHERTADVRFFELLIDAFGNRRIDDPALASDLASALDDAVLAAEQGAGVRVFAAATRTFADLPLLADAKGVVDPAPPPPLAADPADIEASADALRDAEFAANPVLYYLNAHWAYARGVDGSGETTAMVDSGLYAAHEEFADRLHDETVYTVVSDDTNGDGWPELSYFKIGEQDPATAYPEVEPETNAGCQGVYCKFYDYFHGSLMASLAVGARNGAGGHGMAFGAKLVFRPFRQQGTLIGGIYYHPPGDIVQPWRVSRHQIVRQLGDLALGVSNSWLTGTSTYRTDRGDLWPFHQVLTPRYARYQRDRRATDQAVMVWAAGNQPLSAGPLVDRAAVPSVSERQLRALSGGGTGPRGPAVDQRRGRRALASRSFETGGARTRRPQEALAGGGRRRRRPRQRR